MSSIMSYIPSHICKSLLRTVRNSKSCFLGFSTATQKEEKSRSTVDSEDVKLHTKFVDQWWNVSGQFKVLHAYNLLRIPFIRDGLVQVAPEHRTSTPLIGKKVLDVGCGGGIVSMALAKLGAEVTGLDASKELIEMAIQHSEANPPHPGPKPTYLCTSIEEHASHHADTYDGVVASEIIEHINNDQKELFVKSCIQTLKPGGRIFFTTPTRTKLSQFTNIFVSEYILNMTPKGTHQYDKFTTPNELTFLVERSGCHVEAVLGIFYSPLQNRWMWINSTDFFFALQAIKLKGD